MKEDYLVLEANQAHVEKLDFQEHQDVMERLALLDQGENPVCQDQQELLDNLGQVVRRGHVENLV